MIKTDFGQEDLAPEKSDIDQQRRLCEKRRIQNKMEEIEKFGGPGKAVIHYYHISACHNFSAGTGKPET